MEDASCYFCERTLFPQNRHSFVRWCAALGSLGGHFDVLSLLEAQVLQALCHLLLVPLEPEEVEDVEEHDADDEQEVGCDHQVLVPVFVHLVKEQRRVASVIGRQHSCVLLLRLLACVDDLVGLCVILVRTALVVLHGREGHEHFLLLHESVIGDDDAEDTREEDCQKGQKGGIDAIS